MTSGGSTGGCARAAGRGARAALAAARLRAAAASTARPGAARRRAGSGQDRHRDELRVRSLAARAGERAVGDPAHRGRAGCVAHVRDRARAVARRRVALRLERGVDLAQRVGVHAELGGAGADRRQRRALGNRARIDREPELGHELRGRCERAVGIEGHASVREVHACRHAARS